MNNAFVVIDLNSVVCLNGGAKNPGQKARYIVDQVHAWVEGKGWKVGDLRVIARQTMNGDGLGHYITGMAGGKVKTEVQWGVDARQLVEESLCEGGYQILFLISNDKKLVPAIRNCVRKGVHVWAAGTSMSRRLRKSATQAMRLYRCIPRYEPN